MKLHTELLQLKALLVEELACRGWIPWRDLESVEVDLSGGELVVKFSREAFRLFPVLRAFAARHGLELASWDPEEKRCSLAVRETPPCRERLGPRVPEEAEPGGAFPFPVLRRRYARAVRAAFGEDLAPQACLQAARAAWALERHDFVALWLEKADRSGLDAAGRAALLLWEAFLVHLREARSGRRSYAYTRLFYGRVLAEDPADFHALFNLGLVHLAEGRRGEAARFFRKALAVRSGDDETARLLAEAEGR